MGDVPIRGISTEVRHREAAERAPELRAAGLMHVRVFGSTAREEAPAGMRHQYSEWNSIHWLGERWGRKAGSAS